MVIFYLDRLFHVFAKIFNLGTGFFRSKKNIALKLDEIAFRIDVVIPLVKKDLPIVVSCIRGLRENCINPIGKIFIIAPDIDEIRLFCEQNGLIFLEENKISPINKSDLAEKIDSKKVGWILQQLIKLNADTIEGVNRYFLLMDADTILSRKQFFITNKRYILKWSDEFHFLYRFSNRKILGYSRFIPPSYIAHHQLIDANILSDLKRHIEKVSPKMKWFDTIIGTAIVNNNYFSEYELYATFLLKENKSNVVVQYWFNSNKEIHKILDIKVIKISQRFLSASFHNYLRD
jgi:hypothetical protein